MAKNKQNLMIKGISQKAIWKKKKNTCNLYNKKLFHVWKAPQIKKKINNPIKNQITEKEYKWFLGQEGSAIGRRD